MSNIVIKTVSNNKELKEFIRFQRTRLSLSARLSIISLIVTGSLWDVLLLSSISVLTRLGV